MNNSGIKCLLRFSPRLAPAHVLHSKGTGCMATIIPTKRTLVNDSAEITPGVKNVHASCQLDKVENATLYVHWPYCERRCTYCNFNKYISNSVDHGRMERCMMMETETLIKLSGVKRIDSVFFGGGTPSLAPPTTLNSVLDTISKHTYLPKDAEVSIEVNPTPRATSKLSDFRSAGINRLSIGVQALNNKDLQSLGRDHTVQDSLSCIKKAKQLFPGRMSMDMIFGRHGQMVQHWLEELQQLIPLLDGHISLYQLTVERGTKLFKQVADNQYTLPEEECLLEMYCGAVQLLESYGLDRYEVSNFALKGCESVHNRSYWQGNQYIGVGPGAHGRFTPVHKQIRQARIQTLEPDNWMYEVEQKGHATRKAVDLSQLEILEELLMTGLRTREGIPHKLWRRAGENSSDLEDLWQVFSGVQNLVSERMLVLDSLGLRATPEGLVILDSLLPHLLTCLHQLYLGDAG